jgi:hypothetical protein
MKTKKYAGALLALTLTLALGACSNDDDGLPKTGEKEYVLQLPIYQTTDTLDVGDVTQPVDSWEAYGNTYYWTYLHDKTGRFEFDCTSSGWGFGMDAFGFTNATSGNYSAVTKKGVSSATYIVAGISGYGAGPNSDREVSIRFKDGSAGQSKGYSVKGLYVTNSVYAYESMTVGSPFFNNEDVFGDSDELVLAIYNFDKTKYVEYDLAKGKQIVNTWEWVDLSSLGETTGLKFAFTKTKENSDGPMTPTYFCLDGITLVEK